MLLCINDIANRACAAVAFSFESVFSHAPVNLLGKIGRVILSIALQNGFKDDSLCALGDLFSCRDNLNTVFLEQQLISGAVIPITGKPVQLPNDNHVKETLIAVLDHGLKLRTVVCSGGIGPVDVMLQNGDVVLLSKGCALTNLTLDGFLTLIIGGIAGIDDGFHDCSSMMRYRLSFSFALAGVPGSKHISRNLRISACCGLSFGWKP